MPTAADEDSNPFEDLLENNNLPDPSTWTGQPVPAIPPLPQAGQEQQLQPQEAAAASLHALPEQPEHEQGGGGLLVPPEASLPIPMPTKVVKSFSTKLLFKTDLSKSSREAHPCGVLHFTRRSNVGGDEACFVWIDHHENPTHVASTFGHMSRFGFDPSNATFIPYSSRRGWIEKYPLAFPHVHCGENGAVVGYPYWSVTGGPGGSDISSGRMMMLAASSSSSSSATATTRGRKKKKIFSTAHLPNDERDELHIEIYKYFQWLHNSLYTVGGGAAASADLDDENDKKRAAITGSAAGIDLQNLSVLMENIASTFKVVRNAHPDSSTMPFLEQSLSEPLRKLAAASKRDPQIRATRTKRSKGLDFDEMFDRLVNFQQLQGHVNVPQKYAQDGQLGSWVANMRSKRKTMAKAGEEFELDLPEEEIIGDDDDELLDGVPQKKRKVGGGRQKLTQERINRLDHVGFQWIVANPNTKTWEERFEELKEYQNINGTTRVPRSAGTLGEWVHMQRRRYTKKDKNFMEKKAAMLDNLGFEWNPRKHALVSWEDNFNRLVNYGRLNRHYNVQSPFPDGYVGNFEDQSEEVVEQHRFSKWVRRIHAEYRSATQGKGSRMLNDTRIQQLRDIGFQFA